MRDLTNNSFSLSEFRLNISVAVYDMKLFANSGLNSEFVLLIQSDYTNVHDGVAYKFTVQGNTIQSSTSLSNAFDFTDTFACDQYLITLERTTGGFSVYYAVNLTKVDTLATDIFFTNFYARDQILIAEDSSVNATYYYDFSKDASSWLVGHFYRETYPRTEL